MPSVVVTGVPIASGLRQDAPSRLEIHDFVKLQDQFSLYIQALGLIYGDDQTDVASFFQMSGIHGLPYTPWDDSGGSQPESDAWGGYCTHGSVLFPAWHRPYLALFEQILQAKAMEVAKQYPDQNRWISAAQNLRQPYWDWASNMVPPAEVISMDTVNITTPTGPLTVPNPLRRYKFHPIDPSFGDPYTDWPTTLRHPNPPTGPNSKDNVNALVTQLRANQKDITSKTYQMLTIAQDWNHFSHHHRSDSPDGAPAYADSLEHIHDGIHNVVGGNGQMADPSVAAFDPIFWMHHANVDRMLTLWCAIFQRWVTPGTSLDGTFTADPNVPEDENSALTPFWNTKSSYWAAKLVKNPDYFGYTYPELKGIDLDNNKTGAYEAAFTAVKKLYYQQPSVKIAEPPTIDHTKWTVRMTFKQHEVGSSFSVLLFWGDPSLDPAEWYSDPNYIGAVYAFVNSAASRCANCTSRNDLEIEGFVQLNLDIAQRLGIDLPLESHSDTIEQELRRHLCIRIRKADGTAIDPQTLPSLQAVVASMPMSCPGYDMLPVQGSARVHHEITSRPGGSGGGAEPLVVQ